MDDSAGGARILADDISKFWVELLSQIDDSGKREMFQWFMEQLRKAEKGECKAFCSRALAEYSSVHVLYWTL